MRVTFFLGKPSWTNPNKAIASGDLQIAPVDGDVVCMPRLGGSNARYFRVVGRVWGISEAGGVKDMVAVFIEEMS